MKKFTFTVLIIISLFTLNSCDELITKDVDVPITFEVFQEIDVAAIPYHPDQAWPFEYDGFFDILTHPDVANAIGSPDKIKKIKITKIEYEFKNFNGDADAIIYGDVILPEESFSTNTPFDRMFPITSVKVSDAVLYTELFTLEGNYNKVNEYLSKTTVFEYSFAGASSRNPVNVYMVLHVYATITVEASIDYQGNFN